MACERPKPFHVHETHSHFGNPFLQKSFRLLGKRLWHVICAHNRYGEWMIGEAKITRSEEHTSELQSRLHLVCRLLLEKKKKNRQYLHHHILTPDISTDHITRAYAKTSHVLYHPLF